MILFLKFFKYFKNYLNIRKFFNSLNENNSCQIKESEFKFCIYFFIYFTPKQIIEYKQEDLQNEMFYVLNMKKSISDCATTQNFNYEKTLKFL